MTTHGPLRLRHRHHQPRDLPHRRIGGSRGTRRAQPRGRAEPHPRRALHPAPCRARTQPADHLARPEAPRRGRPARSLGQSPGDRLQPGRRGRGTGASANSLQPSQAGASQEGVRRCLSPRSQLLSERGRPRAPAARRPRRNRNGTGRTPTPSQTISCGSTSTDHRTRRAEGSASRSAIHPGRNRCSAPRDVASTRSCAR